MKGRAQRPAPAWARPLWVAGGWLSLGLGLVGLALPLVPTTPFLLLATACFMRGSRKMARFMLENPWFGALVREYRQGLGIPLKAKVLALALLWPSILASSLLFVPLWPPRLLLWGVAALVSWHILRQPSRDPVPAVQNLARSLPGAPPALLKAAPGAAVQAYAVRGSTRPLEEVGAELLRWSPPWFRVLRSLRRRALLPMLGLPQAPTLGRVPDRLPLRRGARCAFLTVLAARPGRWWLGHSAQSGSDSWLLLKREGREVLAWSLARPRGRRGRAYLLLTLPWRILALWSALRWACERKRRP